MRAWIPRRADLSNISRDFWMPDHSCRVCYECDWQFTLLNQRPHCRICGRVFFRKCTQNTIPVSGDGGRNGNGKYGERIEVCNFCFKLWKQEIASQCNGMQFPPTPPPQDICPSPSVASLDSNNSSTVYLTGPYQHISSNSAAKSPQANGFEPLPGRKQEDILHSERNNRAFSSVEGVFLQVFLPIVLAVSSNASTLRKGVASSNAATSPGVLSSTPWLDGFERRKFSWSTAL